MNEGPPQPEQEKPEDSASVELHELADRIDLHIWPQNVVTFCESQNISPDDLPDAVTQRIRLIEKELDVTSHDNYFSPNIVFLCECFHALRPEQELSQPLVELRDEMSSYIHFRQTLMADSTIDDGLRVGRESRFRSWINEAAHTTRERQIIGYGERFKGRNKGKWKTLAYADEAEIESDWVISKQKDDYEGISTSYIRKDYKDYLDNEGPAPQSSFFHATSSASLSGLAEHHAFVARDELGLRGGFVRSGERQDFSPRVFVFDRPSGFGYDNVNWFDEYPVHFGFRPETEKFRERY
ncbi:MAG: hypothetical protein WCP91_02960, partial [Candidatus Berkelbacteria bacterium]